MKDKTKKIMAAALPIAVAAVWLPQLLSGGDGSFGESDASFDAVEDPAWFGPEGVEEAPAVATLDVLDLGVAGTRERVDRLEQVLAGAELFRAPDTRRQARIVEALQLAVSEVGAAAHVEVSIESPTDVPDEPHGLEPAPLPTLSNEVALLAWAELHTVGGVIQAEGGARCLLAGRVVGVGDRVGFLAQTQEPLVIEAIEFDSVVVRAGESTARIGMARFRGQGPASDGDRIGHRRVSHEANPGSDEPDGTTATGEQNDMPAGVLGEQEKH